MTNITEGVDKIIRDCKIFEDKALKYEMENTALRAELEESTRASKLAGSLNVKMLAEIEELGNQNKWVEARLTEYQNKYGDII